MITSLKMLGEIALRKTAEENKTSVDDPITLLISQVRLKDEIDEVIRLIFSLKEGRVKIEKLKATNERKKEYLWIGNVMGVAPQNRLTTTKVEYLISKTISNIINDLQGQKAKSKKVQEFEDILKRIKGRFFIKNAKQSSLNPEFLRGNSEHIEKKQNKKSGEEEEKEVKEKLEGIIERLGVDKKSRLLYTVAFENEREINLPTHEGYIEYLEGSLLSLDEVIDGRCHICGRDGKVIAGPKYPSGTPLKIYAIDKKGFFSGVTDSDDARVRTHAACPNCLRALMAGNSYLMQNFTARAGAEMFNIYLIPRVTGAEIGPSDLDKWAEFLSKTFKTIDSFKALHDFEEELAIQREFRKYEKYNYFLNILFGSPEQAKFDFKYLIQDVPTTRIEKLRNENKRLREGAEKLLPELEWNLGFSDISRIYPIKVKKQRPSEWKGLVELFGAMLSAHAYPYEEIIKKALLFAHICRFGTYKAFNIRKEKNPDIQITTGILKFNLLLKYLEVLDVVNSREGLEVSELVEKLPSELKSWINLISYNPQQQALFLLGVLIGRIGTAQWKGGDKKKAILNKINFRGMGKERVMELANTVFENLRIYRTMEKNEGLYSIMKQLLDANIQKWSMGPVENVFYILSGYSFATRQAISSKTQTDNL
nr:TIGR02556 family CRISPR-associated protein [Candidatus Freyarchaeota archaeon]